MIKSNSRKQFDCIAMKTDIQKQIYEETQNMTSDELLSYFNSNSKSAEMLAPCMPNCVTSNVSSGTP